MTREEIVDRIWGDAVRRNINIVRDDVVEMVDFVLRKHCPEPQGLDEVPKKDWLDEYNEKVDAVIGSSCYSEKGFDKAAEEFARTTFRQPYSETPEKEITIIEPDKFAGFKAGAKWGEKDTIERAVKWWERNLRYLIATANVRDTYLTDFKRDMEEGL